MSTPRHTQAGFSAAELLITLFIAAAFVATAYQLYSVIIKDGGDTRSLARASNIAYDNLRRYSPLATNPCTTQSPSLVLPSNPDLEAPTGSVSITCPYASSATSKIEVIVEYGLSPQQEVRHAIFVTN